MSGGEVGFVKSLFVGWDFEWNGVSLAALFAVRRATRLAEYQEVGQYVSKEADIGTQQKLFPAFGLSLNFSPDLFKLAATKVGAP